MATTSHQMPTSSLLSCSHPISSVPIDEKRLPRYDSSTSINNGPSGFENYIRIQHEIGSGYLSDDESFKYEEVQESGRTRSSARRANQIKEKNGDEAPARVTRSSDKANAAADGKGKKRKKTGPGGDGSDSEPDDGQSKRRLCAEFVDDQTEEPVCLCPKDVMTCIGILPSHPIIGYIHDNSDDSESSCNDDLTHTVLPTVSRNRREGGEG